MFKVPESLPPVEQLDLVTPEDAGGPETSEESGASVADEGNLPCPPGGIFVLEIVKNGTVMCSLDVTKPVIRFGRSRDCEVPMDHPSISRYHAVLTWKPGPTKTGIFFLKDLNSTHGSFVNKKRIPAGLVARIEPNNSVIKLGGSTRNFILNSIVEFEDEDESVDAQDRGDENTEDGDADTRETDPEILYEQFVTLVLNPTTIATKNEHVFSENPHRVLQQWFEREGLELDYSVTQQGTKFKCTIDIPIEGRDVRVEGTELQARKKDAIDHVCLIACRVLDETLRLYPWQSSRKRKKRARHSDDESDDVLDETEQTRSKRSRTSGSAETFESLMDKWNDCNEQLAACKANLVSLSQKKQSSTHSTDHDHDSDSLDSYMDSISESQNPRDIKIKQSQLKVKIKDLEKKQRVYELLMKAAKPIPLPPQDKQLEDVAKDIPVECPDTEKLSQDVEKREDNLKVILKPISHAGLLTTKASSVFSSCEEEADSNATVVTKADSSSCKLPPAHLPASRTVNFTDPHDGPPTAPAAAAKTKSAGKAKVKDKC